MLERDSLDFLQALTGNGYDDIEDAMSTIDAAGLRSGQEKPGQKLADIYAEYVEETGSTKCDLCALVLEAVQAAAAEDMQNFLDEVPEYENEPNYMATQFSVSEYTRECFMRALKEKRVEDPDYDPREDERYGSAFKYIIDQAMNLNGELDLESPAP